MDPFFQELKTKDASEFPAQASTLLEIARIPLSPGSNESTSKESSRQMYLAMINTNNLIRIL